MSHSNLGLHKNQLPTPCLVIDRNKLTSNLSLMQQLAKDKGVNVRPHAKTHKCSKIVKLQLEYGAVGICVAKISEAQVMVQAGIKGILITSPVVADNKINQLPDLIKQAPDTMLVVDNLDNTAKLNQVFQEHNLMLNVLLDIDAGIGRTGVALDKAVDYAHKINQFSNLKFKGIQCYAGHLQHINELAKRRMLSHQILQAAGAIKAQLLAEGIDCQIQTGSGTGTFSLDAELATVSEIQPGSYCVMDQEYSDIEYKEQRFLPAMTMLTTVISTNHSTHVTVDAGTKSLYKVATKPEIISHEHLSYDWDGFGDEHGKVTATSGNLPALGEVLELIVAHCDPTINLFDYFYITENDYVVDIWMIDARGCCQ
ncbi:MAG: DSD1 family PLP-dependent enzyme [Burkholderiales bacterium]|nr:DSD1 family PLP-dependent enzyme [Burkholderiales bacterium]